MMAFFLLLSGSLLAQDTLSIVEVRAFSKNSAWALADTLKTILIEKHNVNYRDYARIDNRIIALSDSYRVVLWDLAELDTLPFRGNQPGRKFTAIGKDRNENVYLGTEFGAVFKLNESLDDLTIFAEQDYYVHSIAFDARNTLFLVVPYAVLQSSESKFWEDFNNHTTGRIVKKRFLWFFSRRTDRYFVLPSVTYIDSRNRWWLCASAGEFGGDVQVFDLDRHDIYDEELRELNPNSIQPRSVFEDSSGNIYITSGLQHFSSTGEIFRVTPDNQVRKIFSSTEYQPSEVEAPRLAKGLFIGPGAYSHVDTALVFATDRGIFRGSLKTGDRLTDVERIVYLNLASVREPLAIGSKLAIRKLELLPNGSILFLSRRNGFGIYKSSGLKMLK